MQTIELSPRFYGYVSFVFLSCSIAILLIYLLANGENIVVDDVFKLHTNKHTQKNCLSLTNIFCQIWPCGSKVTSQSLA